MQQLHLPLQVWLPRSLLATDCWKIGNCILDDLQNVSAEHQAGFLGFWWSHVPRQRINKFLESFHGKLLPGAKVILIDNRFVEGNSTPICDSDQHGNTYQFRTLQGGSEHRLLKNFYSLNELRNALTPHVKNLTVRELQYYWIAKYQT